VCSFADDEGAEVFVDEEAEIGGEDVVGVAVADGDAVHVLQGRRGGGGEREAAGDGEAIFRRDGGGGEGPDVEENDDGGGGLEFLQEVDEDCGCAVGAAGLVEENADASKT